jgi:hypothetical protein
VKSYEDDARTYNETEAFYQRRSRGGRRDLAQGTTAGGSSQIQTNSENWDDESEQQSPTAASAAPRDRQTGPSRGFPGDARGRRQNYHTTRTISNTHYRAADADNTSRARDRSCQIGGVVAAMNKISLQKDQNSTLSDENASDMRAVTGDRRKTTVVSGGKLLLRCTGE